MKTRALISLVLMASLLMLGSCRTWCLKNMPEPDQITKVEIPIPDRTPFPGDLFSQKVDVSGDGEADGVYLSEDSLRAVLKWEATNRQEYADVVAIAEANS